MPQMINYGNEMLRISPKEIEYSPNDGRSWFIRYSGSSCGVFIDLLAYGSELLAITSKGRILFNKRWPLMVLSLYRILLWRGSNFN